MESMEIPVNVPLSHICVHANICIGASVITTIINAGSFNVRTLVVLYTCVTSHTENER